MLAKVNRVTAGLDYRRIVRSGRRVPGAFTLAYGRASEPSEPLRVGVIVAKNVGNAVHRNLVRRRVKAICSTLAGEFTGLDIVIRALPKADRAVWAALRDEVEGSIKTLSTVQPKGTERPGRTRKSGGSP